MSDLPMRVQVVCMSSALVDIISTVVFGYWLSRRVKVTLPEARIPGYLEYKYFRWCKDHGRSGALLIALRITLHLTFITSLIALFIV